MAVSREQTFFENAINVIAQFDFDKAKEMTEKEKDKENNKPNPSVIWISTLSCLGQLDVAEKSFTGLLFLLPKGFLRKDSSLKSMYELLRSDLNRIEKNGRKASSDSLEKVLAHLCGQLSKFCRARLQLTEFYEHAYSMGANRHINFEELLAHIREIGETHNKNFHHPSLNPLKTSFTFECEILIKLIEAQISMQNMVFVSSIFHLHEVHTKLCAWDAMVQLKDTRGSFLFGAKLSIPAHYQWLRKFKDALTSKFTFYFHQILSKQTIPQEMKNHSSRASVDFHSKLVSFQRKTDAKFALLIFDSAGCDSFKGQGYQHPQRVYEPPQGVESFQAVVSYPSKPTNLWPSIVMTMSAKTNELNTMERIVTLYDNTMQNTYFLTRIEPRITLVVIYDSKKSEKDSYVNNFLVSFSSQLRSNKLLVSLKPGSKG